MTDPWDRLPNEPTLWYGRFEIYRLLGSRRNIHRAYRICKFAEQLNGRGPNNYWYTVAERWRWRERAEAWDAQRLAQFREAAEDRILEAQSIRIDMIQDVLQRSYDELDSKLSDAERPPLKDICRLFIDMLNEQRKELPVGASPPRDEEIAFTADDMLRAQRKLEDWQEAANQPSHADRLLALRECLLHLYPETASARRVAEQAGLSLQRIALSGPAVDTWHAILSEAERNDQICDLIAVAHSEYPNNPELQACIKARSKPTE